MHLIELTERSSSIVMVQRVRKNGFPFINRHRNRGELYDRVAVAFQAYTQLGQVSIQPVTAISALSTMHEDICHVEEDKRVKMIILPFHKQWRKSDGDSELMVENAGHGWWGVNQRVLKDSPCSVGVLVDRGFSGGGGSDNVSSSGSGSGSVSSSGGAHQTPGHIPTMAQRVCILFFGGPDDREALGLGGRMAEHPAIKVSVVRFVEKEVLEGNGVTLRLSLNKSSETSHNCSIAAMDREKEKMLDEEALAEFRTKWDGVVEFVEKAAGNVVEGVMAVGRSGDHDLIVPGKGRFPSTMAPALADCQAEHAELGPIGDLLASSGQSTVSSVLVIQQHDSAHTEEAPVYKTLDIEDDPIQSHGQSGSETHHDIV
ncbi:hypothetical protein RHMOL_Rhmol05G0263500 [Rhododendron molle]|uniref:Uncharacterized protein n=1 Tax=Rhododendron molle TaxID=49168 RepID=A0ACC0NTE1_RHOML|nr:hypothetical protein RHMOL_Rhmol05G0263500 [Rhododendron molle]